jgi:hypothetical protein
MAFSTGSGVKEVPAVPAFFIASIYDKKYVGSEFELTNSKMECVMRFRVFPRNVEIFT